MLYYHIYDVISSYLRLRKLTIVLKNKTKNLVTILKP